MKKLIARYRAYVESRVNKMGLSIRTKLICIFLVVKVIPLVVITAFAWWQLVALGDLLQQIAVTDSSKALNNSAVENIERLTTDTALRVADFLSSRDDDIRYLATLPPTEEGYGYFSQAMTGRLVDAGEWTLDVDGQRWAPITDAVYTSGSGQSTNPENDDEGGFHYRISEEFSYVDVPLYDEIAFIDLNGQEQIKYVSPNSTKRNHPMSTEKKDVSKRENTFVKAETYFAELAKLKPGEIYVSDVIGAYVKSNYIGMYTPDNVANAATTRGYPIVYDPKAQAYAGMENPNGERFEGIVRWATPVTDEAGAIIGYVTFALNHDHIMEFVDHITPMNERYTALPNAFEGNYAFIWDYKCRNICHPRHHSIVGYDPETGEPEIPWLERSIYVAWQQSGLERWTDYVKDIEAFDEQSRAKTPAPTLTQMGLVGLDGRYLNNAPQCTGWMDLTRNGGSGSFYILWSGLYKLTTAAAIPYYTGQYAPSAENDFSRRGFGIVTVGAGLDDFTRPAEETRAKLEDAVSTNLSETFTKIMLIAATLIILIVLIAIWLASYITGNITNLIKGISRFRSGERQYRFNTKKNDEFGTLADSFDDMARSVEDSVKNPLTITDMNCRIIYMNKLGLEICKNTLSEIVGKPYANTSIYPVDSPYYPITALHQGREADIYFVKDSGRYLRGTANYFINKKGRKIGYMIESADVTEMVLETNRIENQRVLLDKIFSASPDLIWYIDVNGTYLAVNPRFASIVGLDVESFAGHTAGDLLPPAVALGFMQNDQVALSESTPMYTEERIVFADGHEETLDSVRTPIFNSNGTLTALLGFARNVDTRVEIERQLRNTQIELEHAVDVANSANQHKGEFLARMSHEIRTPMNAIIGLANIVEHKLDDIENPQQGLGEIKTHVRQIEVSSQHLLGLLNDILDISKIEAGKIELTEEVMDLEKLASTVAGIINPRCDEKSIRFITRFDDFSGVSYLGDSLRLRQVLINLLGNAVKFTPSEGRIDFEITRLDRKDGQSQVRFTVRDSGIGIPEEMQGLIFQPFEQADHQITLNYGGTGLGLSISRRIVQLFGGDIELNSQPNKGSEFSFSIWLRESKCEHQAPAIALNIKDQFAGKRALVVDDVEINRVIVMAMLEASGMAIDEAADGQEALNAFASSEPGAYDLIFMDVQMPVMNGYEATDAIRLMDRPDASSVPIVALTANAFKEDIDKALAHGMNAHITKPVDMDRLAEVLFKYLRPER